jgi:hypothetical protein
MVMIAIVMRITIIIFLIEISRLVDVGDYVFGSGFYCIDEIVRVTYSERVNV